MKIGTNENGIIELSEVYNGVGFRTEEGDYLSVCMRDRGYEFNYCGKWYEAKDGVVKEMMSPVEQAILNDIPPTSGSGVPDINCGCDCKCNKTE
jgi:hypothetical protein